MPVGGSLVILMEDSSTPCMEETGVLTLLIEGEQWKQVYFHGVKMCGQAGLDENFPHKNLVQDLPKRT